MVEFHPYGAVTLAATSTKPTYSKSTPGNIQPASNTALFHEGPHDFKGATILSAICCCLPLGLIGIIYSYKVRQYLRKGNIMKAYSASETTRNILQATVIFGSLIWIGTGVALVYITNHLTTK